MHSPAHAGREVPARVGYNCALGIPCRKLTVEHERHPDRTRGKGLRVPGPPSFAFRTLLRHRVEPPGPVAGYLARPELERRCLALDEPVLVRAPGGFGKTTLLAHCARRRRRAGWRIAWLTLHESDRAGSLGAYLTLAFAEAGVRVPAVPDTGDSWASRLDAVLAAVAEESAPCALILDEVERLRDPGAVAAVNELLRRADGHFGIALALRAAPAGLDVATPLLDRRCEVIGTEGPALCARRSRRAVRPCADRCRALASGRALGRLGSRRAESRRRRYRPARRLDRRAPVAWHPGGAARPRT